MGMSDRESVITHLQIISTWASFARERDLQFFTAKHLEDIAQWLDDAIALLKEQESEEKRILKIVWDILHSGVSTDTEADQDWVYEQIRNQVHQVY